MTLDQTAVKPPYIDALAAALLFPDSTYQRDLDPNRVQRMADAFDVTLIGLLEVSAREDGRYAILDGQHRWAAAMAGHPALNSDGSGVHLVCQVHSGLTVEDEARVFYEIDNGRKALSPWDRWKAQRGAGDPAVLAIETTVGKFDLQVNPAPKDGNVRGTSSLERIVAQGGVDLLDSVLSIATAAYGKTLDGLEASILRGIAVVLTSYDCNELDLARLIEALTGMAPRQIKARASALKEAHPGALPRLTAAVMIDRYNAQPGRKVDPLLQRLAPRARAEGEGGRLSRELAAIRRWAAQNGYQLPADGTVPQRVREAYIDAHMPKVLPEAEPIVEDREPGQLMVRGRPDLTEIAFRLALGHTPLRISGESGQGLTAIARYAGTRGQLEIAKVFMDASRANGRRR